MTPVRPRVEGDREDEILEAALELLLEVGYDRLTMDAVAKQARASKATLYRRWETKPALVIDALIKAKDMPDPEPIDTGTLRGDLIGTFCGQNGMTHSRASSVMGALITAVSTDEEFAERFRTDFVAPKMAATQAIYDRAVERGEIPSHVDVEILGPAVAGVVLHRMYVLGQPPDDATVERVVDHLILPAVLNAPAPTSTRIKSTSKSKNTSENTSTKTTTKRKSA